MSQVNISLKIQNNRDYPQPINVMGSPFNLLDTANARTEYVYNISALVFTNENTVTLQYRESNETSYRTFTGGLAAANLASVITALNQLGIGYFISYIASGQTYIVTNNDNYVFGDINIFNPASPPPAIPPAVTYSTSSAALTGGMSIDVNAVNVVSVPNPSSPPPIDLPVVNGDSVDFYGTAGEDVQYNVSVYNATTATYLYNTTLNAGDPFTFNFVAATNNVYVIEYAGVY